MPSLNYLEECFLFCRMLIGQQLCIHGQTENEHHIIIQIPLRWRITLYIKNQNYFLFIYSRY